MATPLNPSRNLLPSKLNQASETPVAQITPTSYNFQGSKLQQHANPSELLPSFNPFSNSIPPRKVQHKKLPSEKTPSTSQSNFNYLQPIKSKPHTNPSLLLPTFNSSMTSVILPSTQTRQQSKPSSSASDSPAINHLRPLISKLPTNPSPVMPAFNPLSNSIPTQFPTIVPSKRTRQQSKLSSSANNAPAINHLQPLISKLPTNPLPIQTPTIVPNKRIHQQSRLSSLANNVPAINHLQPLISKLPTNLLPIQTPTIVPSKRTHQQSTLSSSANDAPAINHLRPLLSNQTTDPSLLIPAINTSMKSILSTSPTLLRPLISNQSTNPLRSNSIPTILPSKRTYNPSTTLPLKTKKPKKIEGNRSQETVEIALGFLRDEYELSRAASETFPPDITSSHIRTSVRKYEEIISAASKRSVCCSCGKFTATTDVYKMDDKDGLILPIQGNLDSCGRDENAWIFCTLCYTALSHNNIPKFSAKNLVNVTMCQHYPPVLEDLTPIEECLIAKCHPVGTILKLRPGGCSSPANYKALRGHIIVFPQDPGPLLQILPSPELRLDNLIKVFWLGKLAPENADLKPFLQVRKDKVLAALQYLVRHNQVYQDLIINYKMMDNWSDDFIPPEIRENIICLDKSDHYEREGYTVNLQLGNYENDLHAAQDEDSTNNHENFLTGSLYTDVNGERQDPNLQMINALLEAKTGDKNQTNKLTTSHLYTRRNMPIVSYAIHGQATLLNFWETPFYFTGAFPTLFPNGIGGHLDQRTFPVSLTAFAEWALNHYSRRFARHNTFMYLLYDRLQLQSSSLGHKLLIKRENWKSATDDIASLTADELEDAAKAVSQGRTIDNLSIRQLQKHITTIGMPVSESFSQKLVFRSQIRGLSVREGMVAFWLTINPSDLRNPLVLWLAGIKYSENALPTASAAIRRTVATSNPVAVAQFFNYTCKAVFDGLLGTNTGRVGILGQVSNHFGVVETNGRGMLHLHTLVWLSGNLAFSTLRNRLLNDNIFATRMIRYLESIIMQSIDSDISDHPEPNLPNMPPSATNLETDYEFHIKLSADSNAVASKKQMHSPKHNATCFKYHQKGNGKSVCRFGMPRDLLSVSKVDKLGVIHLFRNHGWINPWNPAIATCIRSNHDISWIPTVAKSLSLIYYITNYATKDDISPQQILLKAALLKRSIEKAKSTLTPDATDLRLRKKDMDQFALRCFNSLAHDREISGVQIASSLLQLPNSYTNNNNFVNINLWWLRRYVRAIIEPTNLTIDDSSGPMGEERCIYQTGDKIPVSRFDNYKWRSLPLACLSFFEYCMLVQTKYLQAATTTDIEFDSKHPKHSILVQRLAYKKSQVATITFNGQLSEFQAEEESIQGGHPKTAAIENDLAEILLGLFIPWNQLLPLFQNYAADYKTKRDACVQIWKIVEPTLSAHNRNFAKNIELLRKSKEDCQIDAALRKSLNNQLDESLAYDIDNMEPANEDLDIEEAHMLMDENLNAETLITAYHSIAKSWDTETLITAQRIPALLSETRSRKLELENLQPLDIFRLPTHATSGLKFFPATTLECWKSHIKGLEKFSSNDNLTTETHLSFELDDFNLDLEDGILHPLLNISKDIPNLPDRRSQVGNNPTGSSLAQLINEDFPLNQKQLLVVEKILSYALNWTGKTYKSSEHNQTLLYVGGEGGVGKSQIIKGIVAGMDLINRKEEVILMAPTGAAADNIGGNTYHTSLGISINRTQKATMSSRVRKLWSEKTIMIIDEVSMMDLSMLSTINNQCKIAKALNRNSPDLFGGLPIVILIGDFYQFPPVRGPAFWQEPRQENEEDANGRMIWDRFTNVVILDQQMRQAQDPKFHDLLSRARASTLTEDDLALLNSRTITSLLTPGLENATTIVKLNSLRHHVNRIQMEHFAKTRSQKIYVFPALHTRTKSTGPVNLRLRIDDMLEQLDQGTKIPFPGLFFYTRDMPTVILSNICTNLGQVNGSRGIATGIVTDPTAEFFQMDELYILCTKPPVCVLVKPHKSKPSKFEDLDETLMPVFPLEKSIILKGYSIRRKQAPMCPAFSLTDYKVQGSTLTKAVLDLKDNPTRKGQDRHKKFCSMYVQLSRLQSLEGLYLLQKIQMSDLQFSPDSRLLTEMERLKRLQQETVTAWLK